MLLQQTGSSCHLFFSQKPCCLKLASITVLMLLMMSVGFIITMSIVVVWESARPCSEVLLPRCPTPLHVSMAILSHAATCSLCCPNEAVFERLSVYMHLAVHTKSRHHSLLQRRQLFAIVLLVRDSKVIEDSKHKQYSCL